MPPLSSFNKVRISCIKLARALEGLKLRANGRNMSKLCWELLANNFASVSAGLNIQQCWELLANDVASSWNRAQQPTMLRPFARGLSLSRRPLKHLPGRQSAPLNKGNADSEIEIAWEATEGYLLSGFIDAVSS